MSIVRLLVRKFIRAEVLAECLIFFNRDVGRHLKIAYRLITLRKSLGDPRAGDQSRAKSLKVRSSEQVFRSRAAWQHRDDARIRGLTMVG